MKVCLLGSSGWHLTHLYMLRPFWHDLSGDNQGAASAEGWYALNLSDRDQKWMGLKNILHF